MKKMDPNKAHYVVATAIVVKDNKFLIAKRAAHEKVCPNQWTVPGGKLEVDDYSKRPKDTSMHWYNIFEDVLRREIKEETNLEANKFKYLTSMTFIRSDGVPAVVASFYTEDYEGEIKLCPDLTEHAWVTLEEAKNYNLIEGIYEELEMLDQVLKGQEVGEWGK